MTYHSIIMFNPIIIQDGMGIGVSAWTLARAVSRLGQLGVVSGTALEAVLARRLQMVSLQCSHGKYYARSNPARS